MEQDQAMHAQVGKPLRGIKVHASARRDADFQVLEAPPRLLACSPQSLDTLRRGVEGLGITEPALRQTRRAAVRVLGMAAEDHLGMRLLNRPRHRIDAAEGYEAA